MPPTTPPTIAPVGVCVVAAADGMEDAVEADVEVDGVEVEVELVELVVVALATNVELKRRARPIDAKPAGGTVTVALPFPLKGVISASKGEG
jgi:hypothetical protein